MRSYKSAVCILRYSGILMIHCLIFMSVAHAELSSQELVQLIDEIIMAESSGRYWVAGDNGRSRGLMQIQKANWNKYTSESWDRAFEPVLNKQVGTLIVNDIAKKYGKRANRALIIYTYNTGKFCTDKLPNWIKKHPNNIYRGIYNER